MARSAWMKRSFKVLISLEKNPMSCSIFALDRCARIEGSIDRCQGGSTGDRLGHGKNAPPLPGMHPDPRWRRQRQEFDHRDLQDITGELWHQTGLLAEWASRACATADVNPATRLTCAARARPNGRRAQRRQKGRR